MIASPPKKLKCLHFAVFSYPATQKRAFSILLIFNDCRNYPGFDLFWNTEALRCGIGSTESSTLVRHPEEKSDVLVGKKKLHSFTVCDSPNS